MQMSVGEIQRNYAEAKNKGRQIGILADLNCCSKEDIRKIINAENRRSETIQEPAEKPQEEPRLSEINNVLYARLDELEQAIKALEEEYRKVVVAIEVLGALGQKEVREEVG